MDDLPKLPRFIEPEFPYWRLSFYVSFRDLGQYLDKEWSNLLSPEAYRTTVRLLPILPSVEEIDKTLGHIDPSSGAFVGFFRDLVDISARHEELQYRIRAGDYGPVRQTIRRLEICLLAVKVYSRMVAMLRAADKLLEEEE